MTGKGGAIKPDPQPVPFPSQAMSMRICILIPDDADLTRYDDWQDQAVVIEPLLAAHGLTVEWRAWTDTAPIEADLVLPLMAWGYHRALSRWREQLDRWHGVRFLNPLEVLRWNTDKRYLLELAQRGVAIVPTRFHERLDPAALDDARAAFGTADLVVKPPVSAGSDHTWLLRDGAPCPPEALGEAMLVQPMMPSIASEGEYSLFWLAGEFAHAILKRPKSGDFRVQGQFGGQSQAVHPPAAARDLALATLEAIDAELLYARIDMVGDGRGGYALMEIELIEPWLSLDRTQDGGKAFAAAIAAAARQPASAG
ncbi:MAG: transporter [Blastomonas sp. CACIA14H2]|uniref:ATP-grasp domain-containing protein n=1 Tax=Blastomonas sp. CACIA14H2 TaxID=1419876 RepID=UPI0003D05D05|nr:MAG: transporter [Blastomonas sp. CACIA14H2]